MANYSICGGVGGNTGVPDCDLKRGVPVQIIPGSASFSPSDYSSQAAFQTAFISKIKQASGAASKLFPFPVIQETADKTTAAKTATLGYGLEIKTQRSRAGYEFGVLPGTLLEKKLIKFDGKQIPLFIFDDQGNVWGIQDSALNFKGAKYLIGVEPHGFGDGSNANLTKISISLVDPRDFVENAKAASTTFSSTDLVGLQDGVLSYVSNASNVYQIAAKIVTDEINTVINLASLYSTQLANAALFTAFSGPSSGASFTVSMPLTSVTYNATLGTLAFTLDSTAFGILTSGQKVKIIPVGPATLDAADVTSIEIGSVIVTK